MASPKELVAEVARQMGVPEPTVAAHDRNLAEAGLRTAALRGRGVSHVSLQDAANLIIAVAAARSVKDSVKTVQYFMALRSKHPPVFDCVASSGSFVEDMADIIEICANSRDEFSGARPASVTISLGGPLPRAFVEIWRRDADAPQIYDYRAPFVRSEARPSPDLEFISRFTQITMGRVGELVLGDEYPRD